MSSGRDSDMSRKVCSLGNEWKSWTIAMPVLAGVCPRGFLGLAVLAPSVCTERERSDRRKQEGRMEQEGDQHTYTGAVEEREQQSGRFQPGVSGNVTAVVESAQAWMSRVQRGMERQGSICLWSRSRSRSRSGWGGGGGDRLVYEEDRGREMESRGGRKIIVGLV